MGTSGANVSIRRTRTERGLGDDLHSDLEQHREQLHSAARPPDGAPNGPAEVSSNDGGYPGLPRPLPPRLDDAGGPAGDNVDASAERDPSTSGKVGGEIARSALSIVRRCGRSPGPASPFAHDRWRSRFLADSGDPTWWATLHSEYRQGTTQNL